MSSLDVSNSLEGVYIALLILLYAHTHTHTPYTQLGVVSGKHPDIVSLFWCRSNIVRPLSILTVHTHIPLFFCFCFFLPFCSIIHQTHKRLNKNMEDRASKVHRARNGSSPHFPQLDPSTHSVVSHRILSIPIHLSASPY